MKNELRPTCKPHGECLFGKRVGKLEAGFRKSRKSDDQKRALAVHEEIAQLREVARDKACPNVNSVKADAVDKLL